MGFHGLKNLLRKQRLLFSIILFFSAVRVSESELFPSDVFLYQKTCLWQELRLLGASIASRFLYFAVGTASEMAASVVKLGWILDFASYGNYCTWKECLFISELFRSAAKHVYRASVNQVPLWVCVPGDSIVPSSQQSWYINQWNLSRIPIQTENDKKLLSFIERRWLAKANGFYSQEIDLACPCFGISTQVHPYTTNSYARDPATAISQTYKIRLDALKEQLPYPEHFPLILTRMSNLCEYLPAYLSVSPQETVSAFVEKCALKMETISTKLIIDVTSILPSDCKMKLQIWEKYQTSFCHACEELGIDLNQLLVVERINHEDSCGIRLLRLGGRSEEELDSDYRFLLQWISSFGLTATQVELDRCLCGNSHRQEFSDEGLTQAAVDHLISQEIFQNIQTFEKEEFLSPIQEFYDTWTSVHTQKRLMVDSVLLAVIGLLHIVADEKWREVICCPTQYSVLRLSLENMKEQLMLLIGEGDDRTFFETMVRVEQMHANLLPLLEILSPFGFEDFSPIYQEVLASIPENLKPLVSCGIHASGMASFGGIIKAVEKTIGIKPRVIYGENTYFECEHVLNQVSFASSVHTASEQDWKEVDLLLAQFCPVWKRGAAYSTRYREEPIAANIRKSLQIRQGKPLTVALDSTLDYLDSPQISLLLLEFKNEIKEGVLNFICFRSGSKFDLFGIDNYSGASVFMIHNQTSYWSFFDAFLKDPVLQTDLLSVNWFCLAYKVLAPQMESYRKQIFAMTRKVLDNVPEKFFDKTSTYQIVPVAEEVHPSFIDIKVIGPLHYMKAAALVCGCLYLRNIEKKSPVFYRRSLGFYHANFGCLQGEDCSSVRLTVGLDPEQVDVLIDCLRAINSLNP